MRSYTLFAPAKINLYLEILGDRPDGFHALMMVMQSVALGDRLSVRCHGHEPRILCEHPEVPRDSSNLAYRAVQLMAQRFPDGAAKHGLGVEILIEKHTPVAAGLAGGSSNGAAVLVGLNLLWDLGLTLPELQDLAAILGSDMPFCISGGTAIATGRGEVLSPLPDLEGIAVVLGKFRSLGVSTPWAYQTYRQQFGHTYLQDPQAQAARVQQTHAGPLVTAIAHGDLQGIAQHLHNDLEKVVLPAHPPVAQLRRAFAEAGAIGVMMSGSGPTVFALCTSPEAAHRVRDRVAQQFPGGDLGLWVTTLHNSGIQVIQST